MAFEKIKFAMKTWKDAVSGGTPITAAELNRIEKGISDTAKGVNDLGDSVSHVYALDVSDLDNPPKAFILNVSADSKGVPSQIGGNSCVVFQHNFNDNTYTAQLAFGFGSDKLAIRRKYGSTTWTEWKYLTIG